MLTLRPLPARPSPLSPGSFSGGSHFLEEAPLLHAWLLLGRSAPRPGSLPRPHSLPGSLSAPWPHSAPGPLAHTASRSWRCCSPGACLVSGNRFLFSDAWIIPCCSALFGLAWLLPGPQSPLYNQLPSARQRRC